MIRPVFRRPVLAAGIDRAAAACQVQMRTKTTKMFERKVDEKNEVYYIRNKGTLQEDSDAPPATGEFFEMPDVLLDLDADGVDYVRSFDSNDEQSMSVKWSGSLRQNQVKAQLQILKGQVEDARRKADEILANPANVWRVTSHDIFTAALRGPGTGAAAEANTTGRTKQTEELLANRLRDKKSSETVDRIRDENGIPAHTSADDTLLLQWLLMRRRNLLAHKKTVGESSLTHGQFTKALHEQTSIIGVRRLSSSYLQATGKRGPPPAFSHDVRTACIKLLTERSEASEAEECLIFIANMVNKLVAIGQSSAVLSTFALRLSIETSKLQAASQWLHKAYAAAAAPAPAVKAESAEADTTTDTLAALGGLISWVRGEQGRHSMQDRRLVYQLLTGLDEQERLAPDSFRAIATRYLIENADGKDSAAVYESYVTLLGELGAVRMIWVEWNTAGESHGANNKRLLGVFGEALHSALQVTTLPAKPAGQKDVSLETCAKLDYHSIDKVADDATRLQNRKTAAAFDAAVALKLPLIGYMAEIGKALQ